MSSELLVNIRKLRSETGAGIGDCKAAIQEAGGDLEEAKKVLRRLAKKLADKKASRPTPEGYLAVFRAAPSRLSVVAVACETDFVGRNESFQSAAMAAAELGGRLESKELNQLKEAFEESRLTLIQQMGENIQLKHHFMIDCADVVVGVTTSGTKGVALLLQRPVGAHEPALRQLALGLALSEELPFYGLKEERAAGQEVSLSLDGTKLPENSADLKKAFEKELFYGSESRSLEAWLKHFENDLFGYVALSMDPLGKESVTPENQNFASEVQKIIGQYQQEK